jgi:pilus assembly protein Flp/PilA
MGNIGYNAIIDEVQKSTGKEVNRMLFLPREDGQGLLEYGLILVLVAIVVFAVLALLGPAVGDLFSELVSNF